MAPPLIDISKQSYLQLPLVSLLTTKNEIMKTFTTLTFLSLLFFSVHGEEYFGKCDKANAFCVYQLRRNSGGTVRATAGCDPVRPFPETNLIET